MKGSRQLWFQVAALYTLYNKIIQFLFWIEGVQMQWKRFISLGDTWQLRDYSCQSLLNNEDIFFIPFHKLCVAFVKIIHFDKFHYLFNRIVIF